MNNSRSQLAYPELIDEIFRLSTEKHSGTIFITSYDGHLARIVLTNGEICHLIFDSKHRGDAAISLIKTLNFARLQFVEGVFESTQDSLLPKTEEIFKELRNEQENTSPLLSNFEAAIEHIKKSLARHIGPFAVLICDEYIEKSGGIRTIDDIFGMIDEVALELYKPEAEFEFKEKMKTDIVKTWT